MPANYQEIVIEIDRTLALVSENALGGGVSLSSRFAQLITSARVQARPAPDDEPLHSLHQSAKFALQDLLNLITMAHRLWWMHSRIADGVLSQNLFDQFATADIEIFHVECRSIFDYLAQSMTGFANSNLSESFNKLRERIRSDAAYSEAIGVRIADAVTDCNWFGYLKNARDDIVHGGGATLIFPHADRILFQTYGANGIREQLPPVMFNGNIVDFEIYAGMWLARLYDYLERWSTRMFQIAGIRQQGQATISAPGVGVVVEWMRRARTVFADFAARA